MKCKHTENRFLFSTITFSFNHVVKIIPDKISSGEHYAMALVTAPRIEDLAIEIDSELHQSL
jgi:hypothetical protein